MIFICRVVVSFDSSRHQMTDLSPHSPQALATEPPVNLSASSLEPRRKFKILKFFYQNVLFQFKIYFLFTKAARRLLWKLTLIELFDRRLNLLLFCQSLQIQSLKGCVSMCFHTLPGVPSLAQERGVRVSHCGRIQ